MKMITAKSKRIPTHAFGYTFTYLPDFVRDDVSSLERECVLYSDQWIDELNDFRHVSINLTPKEAREYARRCWAFELFLRAGSPKWARNVKGIDFDIAKDADTYSPMLRGGVRIKPPYHCFAAFLGQHLEAISCGAVSERRMVIEIQGKESVLFTLKRAIQALTPAIRAFNSREKGLKSWKINQEDDVRDLLYVMLKPTLFDLVREEPSPSFAQTHKFIDLCSVASRILIELKWLGRKGVWKKVLEQIHTDIQCYPSHPAAKTIVFIVIDAVRDLPDPRLIERQLTGIQKVRDKTIDIRVFVVEP